MRPQQHKPTRILVVDVGGSSVKCLATDQLKPRKFKSGSKLTPGEMVRTVLKGTAGWHFDAVSIGYPGVVWRGKPAHEPHNLGIGWVGFDYQAAFGRPVQIVNDAAMQALGSYKGGKMLFLGLGTGLGSALIVDGVIVPMELGHLQYSNGRTYEYYLGKQGRKRLGNKQWRGKVNDVVRGFRKALLPDYIVLGGGSAAKLKAMPPQTQRGDNSDAFAGGFRLWKEKTRSGC